MRESRPRRNTSKVTRPRWCSRRSSDWGAALLVIGRSDVRGAGRPYVGTVTRNVLELVDISRPGRPAPEMRTGPCPTGGACEQVTKAPCQSAARDVT